MLKGKEAACVFFIAMASYISLYPIILVVPAAIMFYQQNMEKIHSYVDQAAIASYTRTSVICCGCCFALLGVSYFLEGSFNFLFSTYGFILSVPDLTPNLGVFWYFFTEMFEHFRTFFICVFQINVVIYTVPLSVKLKEHPVFFFYMLVFLIGIFKSYPSFADVGLIFSLMPLWKYVFQYLRNTFVVGCMFISTTVFAPVLYYLWIYAGSANANFYFAIALAFSTAEIFLVTDLMFAFIRREFDLKHGTQHKLPDGSEGQVILD
ncbi:hypothetical protein KUTeg_019560 [Tegillarca granosa]|uniref:Phosphatidylinositol glycan anchor biosynthesis class U protein n=1 Tax=Tegillarca granosa TaxID=220873 RepID=A0ABQ9EEY0_TEGGR|nr:hypothetical protein KUTeg_019560 [Tegillarca granosa]